MGEVDRRRTGSLTDRFENVDELILCSRGEKERAMGAWSMETGLSRVVRKGKFRIMRVDMDMIVPRANSGEWVSI